VFPILPCLLGLCLGWAVWDRWLAQAATLLVWGLFLLPFAAGPSIGGGPTRSARFSLPTIGLFLLSLLLTELGIRLRDRFAKPS